MSQAPPPPMHGQQPTLSQGQAQLQQLPAAAPLPPSLGAQPPLQQHQHQPSPLGHQGPQLEYNQQQQQQLTQQQNAAQVRKWLRLRML